MWSGPSRVTRKTRRGSSRFVSLSQVVRPVRSLPLKGLTTSSGRTASACARPSRGSPADRPSRSPAYRPRRPALFFFGDIDPLLAGEGRARGRAGGQEREEPRPRLGVERRPVLRDLEGLDVAHPVSPNRAVSPEDRVAVAVGQRPDAPAD